MYSTLSDVIVYPSLEIVTLFDRASNLPLGEISLHNSISNDSPDSLITSGATVKLYDAELLFTVIAAGEAGELSLVKMEVVKSSNDAPFDNFI